MRRPDLDERLAARLAAARTAYRYRFRNPAGNPQQPVRRHGEGELLSFCSNDYLGLANHPGLARAFKDGVDRWGTGSGASQLVDGHTTAHRELEEALADWLGRERALLFSTGYMANLGLLTTLLGRGDLALCDRLCHASLLDAALLSRARLSRYRHADPLDAGRRLDACPGRAAALVTDGVFSMDGDQAPLPELAALAAERGSWLCVDDAHALGVAGPGGRGSLAAAGLGQREVPAMVGTLGKAFGCHGAFVAGGADLVEALIQGARSYIFTTAPSAALAEAGLAALSLVKQASSGREKMRALVDRFRRGAMQLGLPVIDSPSPIQPLVLGDDAAAVSMQNSLRERHGIRIGAIRPPTVPTGTARLRITLSAAHSPQQVDRLLDALAQVYPPEFNPERTRKNRGT